MTVDLQYTSLALFSLAVAFGFGPSLLATRGVLRGPFGPDMAKARAAGVTLGLASGALAATLTSGLAFGGQGAMLTASLALLLMLVTMDFVWRWLPLEWVVPLGCVSLGLAHQTGELEQAALGAALGGGLLFTLRTAFLWLRGVEAMGLGDVWLATVLGGLVGVDDITLLLGAAACFGLLLQFAAPVATHARYGVAFGAHMCIVTPLFL